MGPDREFTPGTIYDLETGREIEGINALADLIQNAPDPDGRVLTATRGENGTPRFEWVAPPEYPIIPETPGGYYDNVMAGTMETAIDMNIMHTVTLLTEVSDFMKSGLGIYRDLSKKIHEAFENSPENYREILVLSHDELCMLNNILTSIEEHIKEV